jgi:hypothetical protein
MMDIENLYNTKSRRSARVGEFRVRESSKNV